MLYINGLNLPSLIFHLSYSIFHVTANIFVATTEPFQGNTPLHMACKMGDRNTVELLLEVRVIGYTKYWVGQ